MTGGHAMLRLVAFGLLVAGAVVLAVTVGMPPAAHLRSTFVVLGWWGPAVFAALYAAVSLVPLPKALFTLAAGALFGVVGGLLAVVVGATVGAMVAFYLGRALGQQAVHRLTAVRVDRVDHLVSRRGFLSVLVARLVPVVPFTALNYVAGLTAVRAVDFLLATVLGILPASTAYVVVGAQGGRPGSWPLWAALGALAVLSVAGALRSNVLGAIRAALKPDRSVPR